MGIFNFLGIRHRLMIGFGALILVLAIAASVTMSLVAGNLETTRRMTQQRVPTAQASLQMLNGVNHSLAALRGWMLLGDETFKIQRAAAFQQEVYPALKILEATTGNEALNKESQHELEDLLKALEQHQTEIEAIAQTPDNIPAIKLLLEEASPLAFLMSDTMTHLIDAERREEASPTRKELMGIMADLHGSTGQVVANLRAYLLTGDQRFSAAFEREWQKNTTRFKELRMMDFLFDQEQKEAFQSFVEARTKFAPLPAKLLELRGRKDWNLANAWLAERVEPVAARLGELLNGLVAAQKQRLNEDSQAITTNSERIITTGWELLLLGTILAVILGYFTGKGILRVIQHLSTTMALVERTGNLSHRVDVRQRDELGQAAHAFNSLLSSLQQAIAEVNAVVAQLAELAGHSSRASSDTAANMAEQERQSHYIADAVAHLKQAVEHMNDNTQQAATAADNAKNDAEQGRVIVTETVAAINELATDMAKTGDVIGTLAGESERIGAILDVIREVAEQTNLLALNAAIEAARAGEQGRGFAVVADEVRALAQRTQDSLEEVNAMITSLQNGARNAVMAISHGQGKTGDTVRQANTAGKMLQTIAASIATISDMNAQIASATEEQSSVAAEIDGNVRAINKLTIATVAQAKDASKVGSKLADLSDHLMVVMNKFKV